MEIRPETERQRDGFTYRVWSGKPEAMGLL